MSSSRRILEDFICPLATCSQAADLDNILKIVQSSQYPKIAVVDEQNFPTGIINGRSLLAFIIRQWSKLSQDRTSSINWGQIKTCDGISNHFELTSWIEPIVRIKSALSLEQLLSDFQQGVISEPNNYVVVDAEKKLLGLLDTFRLSQWLFDHHIKSDLSSSQQQVQPIASSDLPLFKFIEQIPVPIMLQTQAGKTLYQNQYWQQQVDTAKISNLLETNKFVQSSHDSLTSLEYIHDQGKPTPYCLKGNYYLSPSFANSSPQTITFESKKILEVLTKKTIKSLVDLSDNEQLASSILQLDSLSSQIEKSEWQYFKIPLKLTGSQFSSIDLPSKVWLLIAINIPPIKKEFDRQESQQTLELVKLNQLKDKFLASISHELKSPLTAIVGLSSLLKDEKLGQLNQRQIRYSELIYCSGRQLMKIVSDMLELSYLATGKLQLNLEPINIRSLCTETYQQILDKLEESNQFEDKAFIKPRFKLSVAKDLEVISADKIRLRQILTYLIENALKFIQWKESRLSTSQKNIAITINYWSNWIAITITDNGIGIPEKNQHLLLEQCCQSENNLYQRYDDTGLVLILAQQLAKAHGGDISFISSWGRGSKFTVLLPSASTKVSPSMASNSNAMASLRHSLELSYHHHNHSQQSPQNLLILVIDSVANQINELYLELRELGYYPIIARTATEALQKARQLKPSKIFLNPDLSKISETDILTALKSDSLTAKIPLFLLVAKDVHPRNYLQADGCLTLPIKPKSLIKILPLVKKDLSCIEKTFDYLASLSRIRNYQ